MLSVFCCCLISRGNIKTEKAILLLFTSRKSTFSLYKLSWQISSILFVYFYCFTWVKKEEMRKKKFVAIILSAIIYHHQYKSSNCKFCTNLFISLSLEHKVFWMMIWIKINFKISHSHYYWCVYYFYCRKFYFISPSK